MAAVVTAKGREIIVGRMQGSTPTQAEPKNVGWGAPSTEFTAASTDVAPFSESSEARVAGTSSTVTTTTTNDTYQVTGTLTASATRAITEVFLSDSSSKPASTTISGGTAVGSSTGTTLTVNSATGFPGTGNYDIQVRTEVMTVTGGQGTTSWTVTRAANGSTAVSTIATSDTVTGGNAPGQTAVNNGNLFLHSDFAVINLNANDSIAFTIQTKFS